MSTDHYNVIRIIQYSSRLLLCRCRMREICSARRGIYPQQFHRCWGIADWLADTGCPWARIDLMMQGRRVNTSGSSKRWALPLLLNQHRQLRISCTGRLPFGDTNRCERCFRERNTEVNRTATSRLTTPSAPPRLDIWHGKYRRACPRSRPSQGRFLKE